MAKSKVALGVELVGEAARLALVEWDESTVKLLALQAVDSRDGLAKAIRSLPKRPASVVCSVPLDQSGIRILNLPPTTEENLGRVVSLEAETALPLDAEDLALSFHVLGMTEQSRLEVLLAAARQTAVQRVVRRVNCLPWISATATVSSIALFNALHQLRGPARENICALLKVEEDSSELLVLDRGRILAAQALPVGSGAVVPEAQPVAVGAGGRETPDLAGAAPAWSRALALQVRYSLQAVCYERGLQIERLYLCGAGAVQPTIDWHFSEQLDMPVSVLAPGEGAAGAAAASTTAYGCALQAVGAANMPLSLVLTRDTVAREVEQRRQSKLSWAALAGALVVALGLVGGAAIYNKQRALDVVNQKLKSVEGAGVTRPATSPGELKASQAAVEEATHVRVPASQLLAELSGNLPENAWLTELNYNAGSGCIVRGYALSPDGAQRTQIALMEKALFDEVTLDFQNEDRIGERVVWAFQISGKLRPKEKVKTTGRSSQGAAK